MFSCLLTDLPSEVVSSIMEYLLPKDLSFEENDYMLDYCPLEDNVRMVIRLMSVSRIFSELVEEKIRTFWRALVEKESLGKLSRMKDMMDSLNSDDLRRAMILLRKFRRLLRKNYNLKEVLVLGEEHVGKSKIIKEYIRDLRWKPSDRNTSRVRADIGEEVYHFDICDGIDGFSEVKTLETFMNAAALVIVLSLDKSVTNSKPFIENLLNRIENMKSIRPLIIPIVFVINKIDITKTKSSIEDVRGLCQELIQSHKFVNTSIVENRTEQDIPKIFSNIANQLEWDDLLLEKIIELDVKLFHHVEEPKEKREAPEESERNQEEELEPHSPIFTKKQPETLMEKEVDPVANNSPKKKKSSNKNCIIN